MSSLKLLLIKCILINRQITSVITVTLTATIFAVNLFFKYFYCLMRSICISSKGDSKLKFLTQTLLLPLEEKNHNCLQVIFYCLHLISLILGNGT